MNGFLSISFRLLINIESLNSIESIGNLVRHRSAPIVVKDRKEYSVRFVPVISGEAIGHGYQRQLAEVASGMNLPLTEESKRGEFLKFADDALLERYGIPVPDSEAKIRSTEVEILLKDVVCDVGGFMYAGDYPVKRTSRFQVGYMIPALEDVKAAALEAQFHVRHAPSSMKQYQAPYNVEVGSAVYTFTFNLDLAGIGVPSTEFGDKSPKEQELANQRNDRVKASLVALASFITSMPYGAKKSRFLPNVEYLSAIAAYSKDVTFIVSPGNSKNFIKDTVDRSKELVGLGEILKKQLKPPKMVILDKEGASDNIETENVEVEIVKTPEAFAKKILETILGE